MRRHPDARLLSTERLLSGSIFDVVRERVRLPSGLEQELLVVDHAGAVAVAPLLPDGELLLVRQYRHAAGDWLLEIPAGRLETGEAPESAARRELEEETGYRAERLERLAEFFPAPGFCSEHMTLFVARDLVPAPGGGRAADADEEIECVRRSLHAVLTGGEVRDAKTLLAAALLAR